MKEEIFFVVISRDRRNQYATEGVLETGHYACEFAENKARQNPGIRYYVSKAQEYFEATDVKNIILLQSQEDTDG